MSETDQRSFPFAANTHQTPPSGRDTIRLGYVGLVDAAPLFVAADQGIFKNYGLDVRLSREVGWATVRDKLLNEELDAAQAPCPMPFATTLGLQSTPTHCVSGMVISRGGNAIVLSGDLWKRGVCDARTFKTAISNSRYFRKYILATVYPYSAHTFLLRDWLESAGIDPERDVQIVTLPPSQMCRNLSAGTIDGFCAGEPWPSLAISNEIGWSPTASVDIRPDHPEKMLMVKESFDTQYRDQHVSLVAALIEAADYCENPANRESVAKLTADRKRVNCPEALVRECLSPVFNYGMGRVEERPRFLSFQTQSAHSQANSSLDWIMRSLDRERRIIDDSARSNLVRSVFKPEIYEEGLARVKANRTSRV